MSKVWPCQIWKIRIEGLIHDCITMSCDKYPGKYSCMKGHLGFEVPLDGDYWVVFASYKGMGGQMHFMKEDEIKQGEFVGYFNEWVDR